MEIEIKKNLSQKLSEGEDQIEQLENERLRLDKQKKEKESDLAEAQASTGDKEVLDELEGSIRKLESELQDVSRALDKENDLHNKYEGEKKKFSKKI